MKGKPTFTHFLSLPFIHPTTRNHLLHYLQQLERIQHQYEVQQSFKRSNPNLLHLTLSMLTLPHEHQRQAAAACLRKCAEPLQAILKGKTLQLSGLQYFTRTPRFKDPVVTILYLGLTPESNQIVQKAIDILVRCFLSQGVINQSQFKEMHIFYDHNTGCFRASQPHLTLFRVEYGGLTLDEKVRDILENMKKVPVGLELRCEIVDISTRGEYGKQELFYEPLERIVI